MTAFDLYLCLHDDKIPLMYFKGKILQKLQITNGKRLTHLSISVKEGRVEKRMQDKASKDTKLRSNNIFM